MWRPRFLGLLLACAAMCSWALAPSGVADEGQWPLSMIATLDLESKGLEIDPKEIWNETGEGLVAAVCRVGGATGSFVSTKGLILTNHHVAFRGIQQASTPEINHLERGFVARSRDEEIPARGYVCRITEGYRDVSAQVLQATRPDMSPEERASAIAARSREIAAAAQRRAPGRHCEVSEMMVGHSYVLFTYRDIQDVRLVCVPPRSVGEFGGEVDNWVWPRHTGDFAFMRAYVAPDGSSRPYDPDNVPFEPRRHLRVQPAGVAQGDFVFLLGYPGRTYRHRSAAFVRFEETIRMPFFADLFAWQIERLERLGAKDEALALRLSSAIKGRANVMKNYRGKLIGLRRLRIVERKQAEEKRLGAWIDAEESRRTAYGEALPSIDEIFAERMRTGRGRLARIQLAGSTTTMRLADEILRGRDDGEGRSQAARMRRLVAMARSVIPAVDEALLARSLADALSLPEQQRIGPLAQWVSAVTGGAEATPEEVVRQALRESRVLQPRFLRAAAAMSTEELDSLDDPILDLARIAAPEAARVRKLERSEEDRLDRWRTLYVEAKQRWRGARFCPDANGTLRLTYGRIRGYRPADGVIFEPITTARGVIEKKGVDPFEVPEALENAWRRRDFGSFADPQLGDVPLGILYDCDTTGGNSGSPVMNARGELVGVNFDRAFEATINDFEWSPEWSRSIGVEIRYVLWVAGRVMGADAVLAELGVGGDQLDSRSRLRRRSER